MRSALDFFMTANLCLGGTRALEFGLEVGVFFFCLWSGLWILVFFAGRGERGVFWTFLNGTAFFFEIHTFFFKVSFICVLGVLRFFAKNIGEKLVYLNFENGRNDYEVFRM